MNNILVSVDNVNFVSGTIIGLESKTEYPVYVQVLEDKNHKTTTFKLGDFETCPSAEFINEQIDIIISEELDLEDINQIKELLKDETKLSDIEKELLNDEKFGQLKEKYDEYFNQIEQEIEEVKIVSDIVDFGGAKTIKRISTTITALGAGIVLMKKGRKKDEFKD